MFHALETALSAGYRRATIIGSDAPTLPPAYVTALSKAEADVSLGPTRDGGYYAISASAVHSRMFEGVRWSTAFALEDTEAAVSAAGLRIERGEWWADVDQPADLQRLIQTPEALPRHTATWIHAFLGATKAGELIH